MNLPFDDHPELKFMMGKRPELLKLIKKSNRHVIVSYEIGEVGYISGP
jgi:hypothetical protein